MPQINVDIDRGKKLSDICSDCLLLILQLRSIKEFGDPVQLRERIINLLEKIEKDAHINGINSEKVQMAKFALAAFIDETIVGSEWTKKNSWLSEPLQLKLFNSFNAGEEFFTRLSQLRQRIKENADVVEVYYLCLALGFRGKYQIESPEYVRSIIEGLYNDLYLTSLKTADVLAPNGKPHDEFVHSVKERVPLWVIGIVAAAVAVCFFIVMSFLISENADDVVKIVQGLIS
ncbi:MAG: type IVB secretion system protein IcmH/DotU [bacterium]